MLQVRCQFSFFTRSQLLMAIGESQWEVELAGLWQIPSRSAVYGHPTGQWAVAQPGKTLQIVSQLCLFCAFQLSSMKGLSQCEVELAGLWQVPPRSAV